MRAVDVGSRHSETDQASAHSISKDKTHVALLGIVVTVAACAPYSVRESGAASNEELCANIAITGSDAARRELLNRKAISMDELRLANAGEIAIGMSPLAVTCSLGKPTERAAETTVNGVHEIWTYVRYKKWIGYPTDSKYKTITFENGKVIALR